MKILTLSTFPFGTPRHGGQHRMSNLVETYRANGHDVRSAGVLGSPLYPPEAGFLPPPSNEQYARYMPNALLMEDWAIGRMAAEDDRQVRMAEEAQRAGGGIERDPRVFGIEDVVIFIERGAEARCADHR